MQDCKTGNPGRNSMKGTPTAYSLHHLESISWNAGRCWKSLSVRVIKYLPCCHNIQIYSNLPRSCHITSGCFDTFQVTALTPTLWPGDKIVVHHVHLLEHSGLPTNSMPWDHLTSPPVATCSAEGKKNRSVWKRRTEKTRVTTT